MEATPTQWILEQACGARQQYNFGSFPITITFLLLHVIFALMLYRVTLLVAIHLVTTVITSVHTVVKFTLQKGLLRLCRKGVQKVRVHVSVFYTVRASQRGRAGHIVEQF